MSTIKAEAFRALHEQPGPFLSGTAWDIGTARLIAHLGYPAVETSSAGLAFSTGRPDAEGLLTRAEMLDSLGAMAAAVAVPLNADLENGFGDSAAMAAETIQLAMRRGIVGGSIEDATGRADDPIYSIEHAAERIAAAAAAARGGPFRFTLTARCDAYMHGRSDLDDVIRRLRAYQAAGADVLAAPGLPDKASVRAVVQALDRPVAMFVGLSPWLPDLTELGEVGVKRVSAGSGLVRAALTGFLTAAREVREQGTFGWLAGVTPFSEFNALFRRLHRGQ